jgi:HNH endonuclease
MTSTMAHRALADSLFNTPSAAPGTPAPAATDQATVSPIDAMESRLGLPVDQAAELMAGVVAQLDPSRLTGPDAARLYALFARVERLSMAGKTLLAPRIDESGAWRDSGHRSPAVMLAELEGVPTGQARGTLAVGHRLSHLPGTEDALRNGTLSGPKVAELSGAAVLDPEGEAALLEGAADQPLQLIKERCQRSRATSVRNDPVAAVRRIHADRYFTWWTDPEGAFCYQGRDNADRGARILQQMDWTAGRLKQAEDGSEPPSDPGAHKTTERNRRADAFYLLMTVGASGRSDRSGELGPDIDHDIDDDADPGPPNGQISDPLEIVAGRARRPGANRPSGGPPDDPVRGGVTPSPPDEVIDRPPSCSVMVRVDLDALLRGAALPGETCEIDNQGPIPVAMARDMANDSFLRFVFHQAGDIRSISHFGRTINRHLRTALAHRDRCCVVPGCGVSYGLEIDHVVPFAMGGPTELSNLALLCHHHHWLKTYEGWTLERPLPTDTPTAEWSFTPMPPFGQEPDPPGG